MNLCYLQTVNNEMIFSIGVAQLLQTSRVLRFFCLTNVQLNEFSKLVKIHFQAFAELYFKQNSAESLVLTQGTALGGLDVKENTLFVTSFLAL